MWTIFLFIAISILFAVEASTSLARVAGIADNNLASGLQVQSGLSLFSRAVMAVFMPTLGGLADSGYFNTESLAAVFISTLFIPAAIFLTRTLKLSITRIFLFTTKNLIAKGSYFPLGMSGVPNRQVRVPKHLPRKLRGFRLMTFLAYLPYYLSWPVVILLLSAYPEDRALIMGVSSVMNGINTLALIVYVDPFLIRLSRNQRVSIYVYHDQLDIRLLSAAAAALPFVGAAIFM